MLINCKCPNASNGTLNSASPSSERFVQVLTPSVPKFSNRDHIRLFLYIHTYIHTYIPTCIDTIEYVPIYIYIYHASLHIKAKHSSNKLFRYA